MSVESATAARAAASSGTATRTRASAAATTSACSPAAQRATRPPAPRAMMRVSLGNNCAARSAA
eukprot:3562774-Lingulodinium_polyedra.AAC.1